MSVGERRARCYRKRGRPLLARGNGAAGPGLLSPHPRRPRPSGARSRPRRLVRRGGRHGLADHDRGREPLMATREHDNDQPGSPWSRTSVQLSALFLLMLLVVGIAIAIFHHGSSAKNPAGQCPRKAAQSHAAGTTTSAAASLGCSLPAGSQQVPSACRRSGVTWQVVGTMSVPQSPTLGPRARQERHQRLFRA